VKCAYVNQKALDKDLLLISKYTTDFGSNKVIYIDIVYFYFNALKLKGETPELC
jgi:hypothetical protein